MQLLRRIRNIINIIVDWFYKPFARFIPHETFKYAATGGANMLLDIFIYFVSYNFILLV